VPTGFEALDGCLPEHGWPVGALTEILAGRDGIGELRLVMPALAVLGREGRWVVWVNPPYVPYAPALAAHELDLSRLMVVSAPGRESLWAAEQALRHPACGAVLVWAPGVFLDMRSLRRLQLAAETAGACGLVFRADEAAREPSPAALRLRLAPEPAGWRIEVLKCRGRPPAAPVRLTA